jgi:hypothetical protein
MRLTLVVPGLLDLPPALLASVDARAPALSRLLASGGPPSSEQDGGIAAPCRACGIARQDDWPVAPTLARAAGIDPGAAYWLCAEPATIAIGADSVRLAALVSDLAPEDAQAIAETLNAHFASDGIAFVAPAPSRWFVRAAQPQRLATRPPEAALGAPLLPFLPAGPDAPRWRRWQTEIEMLLFEHPVARARERAGESPLNGLWLWGGGVDHARATAAATIFARAARVVDLARGSAIGARPPPASFDALPRVDSAAVWIELDAQDAERLQALDRAWMAPVERALDAAQLASAEIVLAGRERALRFRPKRATLAQRWSVRLSPRRARLAQILDAASAER